MQLFRGPRSQRLNTLISVFTVLGILLIVLAVIALVGDMLDTMNRFRQEIFLFIVGAILAYLMAPLVNLVQRAVRMRWAAIATSYILLFVGLLILAFLLINPFISQARALVDNLHNPAASSLRNLDAVQADAARLQSDLERELKEVKAGKPDTYSQNTSSELGTLSSAITQLSSSRQPPGQITIPPSYLDPIVAAEGTLDSAFTVMAPYTGTRPSPLLTNAVNAAKATHAAAQSSYAKAASTPLLLLNLQLWLDGHGFKVDLHDKFGKALQELSNQLAGLLNNAVGIALQAGNLLLNTVLILIISIYFVSDGARFIQWLVRLAPLPLHDETEYFVKSLDTILGSYLRTQVLMALLAATLDALGAVVFGVPYAIVIFMSSFFLSLVPVIGPVILPFPPLLIAVIFTPLPTPIFFFIWLMVGEQLATNVIGPRVQGHSVGIHPLAAMAAALLGFPIAGFLGSFFAVPAVAFLHVVVRQLVHTRRARAFLHAVDIDPTAIGDLPSTPPSTDATALLRPEQAPGSG